MNIQMKTSISLVALGMWVGALCSDAVSQASNPLEKIPDAPASQMLSELRGQIATENLMNKSDQLSDSRGSGAPPSASGTQLTRSQAEEMAFKNNPQVTVAHLAALVQHQVYREVRSAELPTANASLTAVEAEDASRISANSLTASRLFTHAGAGAGFSQLLTDFGKTKNLIASSALQEKAQNASAKATEFDVKLATDQAFYSALQAQETLKVAQQNVKTRQTLQSQVNQMTINKLKSTLDLSFADVSLSQAKLLALDAQNNESSTMAALDAVLGLDHEVTFELVDDAQESQQPPPDVDKLIASSLYQRPDLQATQFSQQAAAKYSHALRDQVFPTIAASGTAGTVPIRPAQYYSANWWGGIGVNVNIPIFNGFLYSSQAKEAALRAQASSEQTRELRDRIVRDVRMAWLTANTSYQRLSVTAELLKQADLGLRLANTRYQMGLSSIVELSQAEYQQTDAAIGNANAQYQYRLALATLNYQVGSMPKP